MKTSNWRYIPFPRRVRHVWLAQSDDARSKADVAAFDELGNAKNQTRIRAANPAA
jgi:hypothetical protein